MKHKAPKKDVALIKALGGPRKLAETLGYGKGGAQRVQNWLTRKTGIPASVKLEHPDIFLRELSHPTADDAGSWDGVTERRARSRSEQPAQLSER